MPLTMPLRIALFSDLHADFIKPAPVRRAILADIAAFLVTERVDVTVFAGDMVNRAGQLEAVLAPLAVTPHRFFVPGNHDIWITERDAERGWNAFKALEACARAAERAGWTYLPGDPQIVGGWGFAGSLGWYDYSFRRPSLPLNLETYATKRLGQAVWNDVYGALFIENGRRLSDPELSDRFVAALADDLRALGLTEAGAGPPTVVTTHMLPYRELVIYRDEITWDFFSAFMGSASLGELYDRHSAVRGVFAGHTHTPRQLEGGDGRIYAISPFGYYHLGEEFPAAISDRIALFETHGSALVRI